MKTRVIAALGLCCALALCLALSACGSPKVDASAFLGEWVLASSSDENIDEESVKLAETLGLESKLVLNEDGTGRLVVLSNAKDITWTATSETEGTVSTGGDEGTLKLHESSLSVDVDETHMTFNRP